MDTLNQNDHDVLIALDTKMTILIAEFKEMRDQTAKGVDRLEVNKVDKDEFHRSRRDIEKEHESMKKEHEKLGKDLETLKIWRWLILGGLAVVELVIRFIPLTKTT